MDEAGWVAWTEAGADADHCTVRIGPSQAEDPVVTMLWARDRRRTLDAEGDGRELPGINAYLVERPTGLDGAA